MLGSVVARPITRVPEIPRRAGKDPPAAAGAVHLPGGDEGHEPLPLSLVGTAVAACRGASTPAGALELLGLTTRARPARKDDLPVPTNLGERAHLEIFVLTGCGGLNVIGGSRSSNPPRGDPAKAAPPAAGFGEAERRTSSAAGMRTV